MPFTPGQQVRNRGAQTFGQASGLPSAVKYGPELRTDGLVTADAAAVSRGVAASKRQSHLKFGLVCAATEGRQ